MYSRDPGSSRRIVVLGRFNDPATAIVVHYLADRFDDVVPVAEQSPSRVTLTRRRARRLGWVRVAGQLAFVALAMPVLRWRGRARQRAILAEAGLDISPVAGLRQVESVNSPECIALLRDLAPAVVVVQGTRIISSAVLTAVGCPFVNTHGGITPRYRGVHGGYWALTEGRPDLVGTTVHLVDPGDRHRYRAGAHIFHARPPRLHRHLFLSAYGVGPAGTGRAGGAHGGGRPGGIDVADASSAHLCHVWKPGRDASAGQLAAVVASDVVGVPGATLARRGALRPLPRPVACGWRCLYDRESLVN